MMLIVQVFYHYELKMCSVTKQMEEMTCITKINLLLKFYKKNLIEETGPVKFACLSCMISILFLTSVNQ